MKMWKAKYMEIAGIRLLEIIQEHPDFKFGEFDFFEGGVKIGTAKVHEGKVQYIIIENPQEAFTQRIRSIIA